MAALEEQVKRDQAAYDGNGDGETNVEKLAEKEEPTPPMQIPLEGFAETITMTPGGDKAKSSSISLRGGKLAVSGQFNKGDVVEFYVRARIGAVTFEDTHDKYGEVIATERKHTAKPIAVRRLASTEK